MCPSTLKHLLMVRYKGFGKNKVKIFVLVCSVYAFIFRFGWSKMLAFLRIARSP